MSRALHIASDIAAGLTLAFVLGVALFVAF
jgi:hypothetical protein